MRFAGLKDANVRLSGMEKRPRYQADDAGNDERLPPLQDSDRGTHLSAVESGGGEPGRHLGADFDELGRHIGS
jgi:hypothetical protein